MPPARRLAPKPAPLPPGVKPAEPSEHSADFTALPWQLPVWSSLEPVVLLTGSAGGGKSRVAAEKMNAYLIRYPGATGLMLRKARESLTNSAVLFYEREILAGVTGVKHVKSESQFRYDNGSVLVYGGMFDEKQRQQIRSVGAAGGVDIAWMEEATAFTQEDYVEVRARLRGRAGPWRQLILTTNPDGPGHWIYKRLIVGREAQVFYSGAGDNPYNPKDYLDTLASLTGTLGLRLAKGLWVQAEGAVYDEWDTEAHIIPERKIGADWRRIRAIDFGYQNAFVCHWLAVDPDDHVFLYREVYGTGLLVEDWADVITRQTGSEPIEATICDHDAEGRATLVRRGIHTIAANKDVQSGIQAVKNRLRRRSDGLPGLQVFENALVMTDPELEAHKKPTCLVQEIGLYTWAKSGDGRPIKEVPVKVNDHACLIAGTLVATDAGWLPIEQVRPGQQALTTVGYSPVVASGKTMEQAQVVTVTFSNGATLTGTGNHPVRTKSHGWRRLDTLRYGDIIVASQEEVPLCLPSQNRANLSSSSSTASAFAAIQIHPVGRNALTTRRTRIIGWQVLADCMKKFGARLMAAFRPVCRFTISTATRSIMTWRTWLACPPRSIMPSTASSQRSGGVRWLNTVPAFGPMLLFGINRPLGEPGIPSTAETLGKIELQRSAPVSDAAPPTLPRRVMATSGSAQMPASQPGGEHLDVITSSASAQIAGSGSQPTSTPKPASAPVYVLGTRGGNRMMPVYNIETEASEYFANGVLVHNCDALRYGIMYLDGKNQPPPPTPGGPRFAALYGDRQPELRLVRSETGLSFGYEEQVATKGRRARVLRFNRELLVRRKKDDE